MATIFIQCLIHCCTQVMAPDSVWDRQDKDALQSASVHCREEDKCLTKFRKVEQGIYTAICGKENN